MLRVAVIGVGSMGKNHVRVFTELDNAELVGVADTNEDIVNDVAQKFGTASYADYRRLLQELRPDAVSIVVPTALHEEVAGEAMRHGAHVLIEKPIGDTVEAGRRLVNLAESLDRQLMVGHILRFNPAILALKQMLDAGKLGRIYQVACRRVGPFPARIRDVGVVIDLASHDLDIMNFLTGSRPETVFAETVKRIHTQHEDLMTAVVRFPNEVVGLLEINWLTPTKVREIRILGERGMYVVNDLTQDLYFYENAEANGELWHGLESIKGVSEGKVIRYAIKRQEPLKLELAAFVDALESGDSMPVSGEDSIVALRVSLAIVESGLKHQRIDLMQDENSLELDPLVLEV